MAEGGFDDFEMKNKYRGEEEDENDNEETSFVDARENLDNPRDRLLSPTYSFSKKIERVEIPDMKRDSKRLKKSMTEDVKKSFKKYLM